MKDLKETLKAHGLTAFEFHNGGKDYHTALDDLHDDSILAIIRYGKRMFNDAVNSAKNQGKEPEEFAKEWLDKAAKGQLGTRTGGARLSPLAKALREIVVEYLRAAGWDAKDAAKDAKEPAAAFRDLLGLQISRARGVPLAEVPKDDIQAAMDKNWPKIEARAQEMVTLAETDLGIEI